MATNGANKRPRTARRGGRPQTKKTAQPQPRRAIGLRRRWLKTSILVTCVIVAVFIAVFSLCAYGYYHSGAQKALVTKADSTTSFFNDYLFTTYGEYYQSACQYAESFHSDDILELQFINARAGIERASEGAAPIPTDTEDVAQALESRKTSSWSGREKTSGARIMSVTAPLFADGGQLVGAMRFVQSLERVDRQFGSAAVIALVVGLLIVLTVIVLLAIFADVIADYNDVALKQNPRDRLQLPSAQHWLGTDNYGRDLFARIVHGARYSLLFGIGCTALSLAIGCVLGAATAYYGGALDSIVMRFLDTVMCIPSLLLALTIVAVCGSGLKSLTIAITVASVPGFTRMVRSVVLSVVSLDFIEAARSCGTRDSAIIFGHILPNAIGPIIVNCMMNIAGIIMTAAGLSYLGMGIKPPAPEWGSMLSEGREFMRYSPYITLFPGIAIILTSLSLNLLGDGLRDALDPKLKN